MKPKTVKLPEELGNKLLAFENHSPNGHYGPGNLRIVKISDDPSKICENSLEAYLKDDDSVELVIRGSKCFGAPIKGLENIKLIHACCGKIIEVIDNLQKLGFQA